LYEINVLFFLIHCISVLLLATHVASSFALARFSYCSCSTCAHLWSHTCKYKTQRSQAAPQRSHFCNTHTHTHS